MKSAALMITVVLAVLTVTALTGTSTALAEGSTQLCQVHTNPVCEGPTAVINLENEGLVKLLSSVGTVLCLSASATGIPLELGKPQVIHTLGLSFDNCGTDANHTNCTVTVEEMPDWELLRLGLDKGSLKASNGLLKVKCGAFINCKYNLTGFLFEAGNQHLTAEKKQLTSGTGFLCPQSTLFDGLLKTTQALTEPSLCKVHASICKTENLVKSVHIKTTTTPVLLNAVANIECESSLGSASVTDPMLPYKPIKLNFSELKWSGCHPKGSGESCTVTTPGLPTLDLTRTALNLGSATTLGLKVSVVCASLALECVFGSEVALAFEGALHTEGAGHGMFTAGGATLAKLEGGGGCPESVQWDALYELPEHTYLGPALEGQNAYVLE